MGDIVDINLYKGDCLDLMDELAISGIKFDAIISDIPYGTTKCKWDTIIPFDLMWDKLHRIRNDSTPIMLFGAEPFSSYLRTSNIKEYKYDWIWEKSNSTGFLNAKKQPLRIAELISVFYKKQTLYNPQMTQGEPYTWNSTRGQTESYNKHNSINNEIKNKGERYPLNILKFKQERGLHPNQKPVPLLEYLVKTYTNEGDTVLDFTMGSGSTGVACKNLNRKFIGIELNQEYFKIAESRMAV